MKSTIDEIQGAPKRPLFEVLADSGISLPRPNKLTDGELTAKLWEVIDELLKRRVVLCNTDHLSDRELYALLWCETLRSERVLLPAHTLHIDMTRTGVDEGMPIYLEYYATEEQRQMFAEVYPEYEMPERVEPPARRDHLIRLSRRKIVRSGE